MKVVVGHKKQNNKKFYMLLTESLTAWLLAAGILLTAVQVLGTEMNRFFLLVVTLIPVLLFELAPWEAFAGSASLTLTACTAVLTLTGQKNFINGLIVTFEIGLKVIDQCHCFLKQRLVFASIHEECFSTKHFRYFSQDR